MTRLLIPAFSILILLSALPALAQDDDDRPSPFSFQGRVGALLMSEESYESGATFEFGMMARFAPNIHLNITGGSSNFKGSTDPLPLTEEYASFIEEAKEEFHILDPEKAQYRISFGTVGVALKLGRHKIDPYFVAGVGIYYTRFVHQFNYADKTIPLEFLQDNPMFLSIATLQDSKYLYGWHAGGGVNVAINQIIGFGGQVTYHSVSSDALAEQITATFGLNVIIP